jgi:hypothetical protein
MVGRSMELFVYELGGCIEDFDIILCWRVDILIHT